MSTVSTSTPATADRLRSVSVIGTIVVVFGIIMILAGGFTWYQVQSQARQREDHGLGRCLHVRRAAGELAVDGLLGGHHHREARPRGERRQDVRRACPRTTRTVRSS